MLMTLRRPLALILWHSGTGQPTGSNWHALAHPESGTADGLSWTCCVISQPFLPEWDMAEHLLPSENRTIIHSPSTITVSFWFFGAKPVLLLGNVCYASVCLISVTFNHTCTFLCIEIQCGLKNSESYIYLTSLRVSIFNYMWATLLV